jgi:hypothetical protein
MVKLLHLAGELLKSMVNLDAATVPFNNTAGVLTALRGSSVQVVVEFLPPVLGQIRQQPACDRGHLSHPVRAAAQRAYARREWPARL